MAVLPAGFIFLTFRPAATSGYRWSCWPSWEGEGKRALRTVAAMLAHWPQLSQTRLGAWREALL
eukprot:6753519-Pyramimonas_sp.AAC.1